MILKLSNFFGPCQKYSPLYLRTIFEYTLLNTFFINIMIHLTLFTEFSLSLFHETPQILYIIFHTPNHKMSVRPSLKIKRIDRHQKVLLFDSTHHSSEYRRSRFEGSSLDISE